MSYGLVADIGGTNSRFALCETGCLSLHEPRKYPNKDFASLQDAISHYLQDAGMPASSACLAVAGPTHGETISLTNIDWKFNKQELAKQFGFQPLHVTNDFTALAMAVPHLSAESYVKTGGDEPEKAMPVVVVGPGTGLGVSALIWHGTGWTPVQSEGGNAGFAPATEQEADLYARAVKDKGFVRSEDFISGIGLSYLHDILLEQDGQPRIGLKAEEITWRAKTSEDDPCRNTVNVFCGMLGNLAGNLALTFGAFGGVYIGGGVVPQLEAMFIQSPFRQRFEARGPFTDYVRPIPTFALHAHSRYALMGAAAILAQAQEH